MAKYSDKSNKNLSSCVTPLQRLFNEVIKDEDCSILCGYRGPKEQNTAFNDNRSSKKYPESKHNVYPSEAVDVAPYPIDWNDKGRFYMFAKRVYIKAEEMGIKVRWGGDWDGDGRTTDQSFHDLPHWELVRI